MDINISNSCLVGKKDTIIFGLHNFFQLMQWIFLSPSWHPNQKLLIIDSIVLHNSCGKRKQPIMQVGIDCAIDLIRTSLLAIDRNFSFYLFNFFQLVLEQIQISVSLISQQRLEDLSIWDNSLLPFIFNHCCMAIFLCVSIFWLKEIFDLSKFLG